MTVDFACFARPLAVVALIAGLPPQGPVCG